MKNITPTPLTRTKPMTEKQKQEVCQTIDNEGFDYTFVHYSSWKEIEDKKFHELLNQYKSAKQAIENYIDYENNRLW